MAVTEFKKLKRRSRGPVSHGPLKFFKPTPYAPAVPIFDAPRLTDISAADWQTKKEVFVDHVSSEWGNELGKRMIAGTYYGIKHKVPETKKVDLGNGRTYLITTISSVFVCKSGKESRLKCDQYESFAVNAETATEVITGNFLDKEMAEEWIKIQLEI